MTDENKFRVYRQPGSDDEPRLLGAFTDHDRARDLMLAQSDAGKAGGVYVQFPANGARTGPRGATRRKPRFTFWRKSRRKSRRARGAA